MKITRIGRRGAGPSSALASLILVLGLSAGAQAASRPATTAGIPVFDARPQSAAYASDTDASILCGRAIALNAAIILDPANASAICADGGDFGIPRTEGRSVAFIGGLVPEASVWAMIMLGFAGVGAFLRGRRRARGGSSRSSK